MTATRTRYIAAIVLLLLLLLAVLVATHYKPPTQTGQGSTQNPQTASNSCDASLWQHVFHPGRLHVLNNCVTVTGSIDHSKQEPDGDVHIRLKLDAPFDSMLDAKNTTAQKGDLVLEPVCEGAVKQSDATDACQNYHSPVVVPRAGTHVKVIGSYVLDADHGWNEIHPVTSISAQ